jgi:hypothetical protein
MNDIKQKLDMMANLQLGLEALRMRKQEEVNQVLTPEINARLAAVDAKYLGEMGDLQDKIAKINEEVRAEVLAIGASVKGTTLHAVWVKGRVSWDTKALDGYAAGHPEISQFRKEGQPSVSIRPVTAPREKQEI